MQVVQDFLLVRQSYAEAGNTKRMDGGNEIIHVGDAKRKKNRVNFARVKPTIEEGGREGMRDGVANHAEDASFASEIAAAVEFAQFGERNLARRGGLLDRSIGKGAPFVHCENAHRCGGVAHGDRDYIAAMAGKREKAQTIMERFAFCRDFDGIEAAIRAELRHMARDSREAF